MLLHIGPRVREEDLASLGTNIGKSIIDVRQVLKRQILRVIVASVDGLVSGASR